MEPYINSDLPNESIVVEQISNIEILITSQEEKGSSQNLFLKGEVILNNDRLIFKGMHRMEYFSFYIKIYNFLTLRKHSDYIIIHFSDMTRFYQNQIMGDKGAFDRSEMVRDSLLTSGPNLSLYSKNKSKISSKKLSWISSKVEGQNLIDQFKEGKEFELLGNFQIRVIKRNQVILYITL